ncbi:probable G-protein coupled receptor No9 isoform X2 [Gigantopelta aegis]|uniref:probable G-protein coupled receptor No9 isoform X2 n=1 Tax=Gigantopelta aegis TaxID=1735272 RepID=UPI001B88A997|nr:probable G-protein coupled receptor No9 isoform X2 [Gigantopelta aegis]
MATTWTPTTDRMAANHDLASDLISAVDNVSKTLLSNTSADTNQTDQHRSWNLPFSVTMATILSISSFLSIVGNLMVITVVVRHRGMRTRTNLFLVNLAVADFCVGAVAVPFAIVTLINGRWVLGDVLCQIDGFVNIFFLVASIHTLMYISIHKYYSITRPFSDSIQLNKVVLMMAATWIWAGIMGTITISGLNYVYYKPGTSQCGPSYPHDIKGYIHHGVTQVTCIFIPLSIMVFCYVRMFKEIREHSKRLQLNSTLEKDVVLSQQKRVAITLFIVLACFVLCWIPYHIYASYVSYRKDKAHFSEFVNPLAYMLGYMNSAFNPIIYAFRSPSFREGYKEILCQTPTYVVTDGSNSRRYVEKYHLQGTSMCDQENATQHTTDTERECHPI